MDTEQLGEMLQVLLNEHGFTPPLYVAIVAKNGSSVIGAYRESGQGLDFQILAQHVEDEFFAVPVNVMVVDSATGNAARVLLSANEKPKYFLH